MLLLMFRVVEDLYAVDAARVREVVPRVSLRPVPHAPRYLAGLFEYRGVVVPVVDLGLLLGAAGCRPCLSTRIIVVESLVEGRTARAPLGLVAEQVSDVRSVERDQRVFPPTPLEQAPYLGAIVRVAEGLVQLIEVDRVLTGSLAEALWGARAEEP